MKGMPGIQNELKSNSEFSRTPTATTISARYHSHNFLAEQQRYVGFFYGI